jgi:hypothetical protein
VLKNVNAAGFAVKTQFSNPIYKVEVSDNFKKLKVRIVEAIERMARLYA